MPNKLREGLPEMPPRIARLPVDERGYPVPWFVQWIDGKPDFRVADSRKIPIAIREKRCWICGDVMGRHMAFLLGPMCAVNRTSAEPPSHRECAIFSARACPFLTRPHAVRREHDLPEGCNDPAGVMLKRNPGVSLVWITKSYSAAHSYRGLLFTIGEPEELLAYAEGRKASVEEIRASIESGIPLLREPAEQQGPEALVYFAKCLSEARTILGI